MFSPALGTIYFFNYMLSLVTLSPGAEVMKRGEVFVLEQHGEPWDKRVVSEVKAVPTPRQMSH